MHVKGLGAGIHFKEPHHQQTRDYLFRVLNVIDPMRHTKSTVKDSTLNTKSLAMLEIPLPPLSEQVRIVTRIDEFRERLAVPNESVINTAEWSALTGLICVKYENAAPVRNRPMG
jgi:hypothetical protein